MLSASSAASAVVIAPHVDRTVGDDTGTGPRWHEDMVSTAGFVARHPPGY